MNFITSDGAIFKAFTCTFGTMNSSPEKLYECGKYTANLSSSSIFVRSSSVTNPSFSRFDIGFTRTSTGLLNFFYLPTKAENKSLRAE